MFDVPYVNKETKNGPTLRPRKRCCQREKTEREEEDEQWWFEIRSKENDWKNIMDDNPCSQLRFCRSNRLSAFHKKMSAGELGKLLELFRFDTVAIVSSFFLFSIQK